MPHPYPADGIPTLTQRIEDDIPVLDTPVSAARPQAAQPSPPAIPEAVLRAAVQAELEQAVNAAVQEASALLRERLEAELPAIMARALSRVRPG